MIGAVALRANHSTAFSPALDCAPRPCRRPARPGTSKRLARQREIGGGHGARDRGSIPFGCSRSHRITGECQSFAMFAALIDLPLIAAGAVAEIRVRPDVVVAARGICWRRRGRCRAQPSRRRFRAAEEAFRPRHVHEPPCAWHEPPRRGRVSPPMTLFGVHASVQHVAVFALAGITLIAGLEHHLHADRPPPASSPNRGAAAADQALRRADRDRLFP